MRVWEQRLSGFVRSKAMTLLLIIVSAVMIFSGETELCPSVVEPAYTFALTPAADWISNPTVSLVINVVALAVTALLMVYINRRFNILRTSSKIYAGLFLLMTAATPQLTSRLSASPLLAIAVLGAVTLYFMDYNRPKDTRPVFLSTTLIGTVGLFSWPAFFFIPVFLAGLAQMRILSVRSVAAAVIGMLTPIWIVWGLGLADFDFTFDAEFITSIAAVETPCGRQVLVAVALTLLAGLIMGSAVLLKILSFNVRARSLNGLLSLLSIATGVMLLVNYNNLLFYMTVLNATVAFQAAHFLRINRKRSGYISILLLVAAYVAVYLSF